MSVSLTSANAHDVTQLVPLVDAIPPIKGRVGRPRFRPDQLYADRAYDSFTHRLALKLRAIQPMIARRGEKRGSGLGVYRWVVERTHSWMHQHRRLRVRFERRADTHEAFLRLACAIICCRILHGSL